MLISIDLESLTSKSCSPVLWISFFSISSTDLNNLIAYLLKISSATYLVLLNLIALKYYSFKVSSLFISDISTSLQTRLVFNPSLNITIRAILLYLVKSF